MPLLKLLHIFFIILWAGSLLVIALLLRWVSQEDLPHQLKFRSTFQKYYRLINVPSMAFALVLGGVLIALKGVNMKAGWFHMKMTFMLFLVASDVMVGRFLQKLPLKKTRFSLLVLFIIFSLVGALASVYILKPLKN